MNVKTVKLTRTYNLGEYESLKVGYEAELSEVEGSDNQQILDATKELEKLADTYYTLGRFQKPVIEEKKPESKPVDPVISKFPVDLQQHLSLSGDKIKTEYVSREKFMEINEAAKQLGYEYVSGKGAHWRKKQ